MFVYLRQRHKSMKERYDLPNRSGDKNWLEKTEGNEYVFKSENNYPVRIIYDRDTMGIKAIDPSGGPFLHVDYNIEDVKVSNIKWVGGKGFIITLQQS